MFSSQLLIFSIIVLWLYVLWTRRRYYQLMLKIPGPWGYPLLGIALKVRNRENVIKVLEYHEKKTSNHCFLTWLAFTPFFIVAEPQIAQDLLTSPNCVNRTDIGNIFCDFAGHGLFFSKDPLWSQHRKLLNPSFSNKVLTSFFPVFNEETDKLIITVKDYCGCGDVNIYDMLKSFTFTLTTRNLMDRDLTTESINKDHHFAENYEYLIAYLMDLIVSPWLKPEIMQRIFNVYPNSRLFKSELQEFIRELIDKRIAARKILQTETPPGTEKNNFINLALRLMDRGDFSYQNVEDHAHSITLAGFETTNNEVSYILMLLGMFPEYQEKLFEEIYTLYPDVDDFDITLADTQQMVYMDMVVNEAMRVMAPVPVIFRELSDDITLSNGITIPKGAHFGVDCFNMQRRTDIWGPEAHVFNPDNFLPANLENKHPYGYLPFAKGVRNCIGWRYALLSVKVVLAKLIRNYQFKTDFKFEDLEFVEDVTLKLKVTPKVKIFKRNI